MINLKNHYQEKLPDNLLRLSKRKFDVQETKTHVWNEFIDSELTDITEADCSVFPRVLPASYKTTIEKTARQITEFVMKLVSLRHEEVEAIVPKGPIRDFLIQELKVLKYRPNRYIGSFRFDMAIVGEPVANNPPQLLEINEIGFDGLSRMPFIQEVLFKVNPNLKKRYFALDTTLAELKNMKRLGKSLARFQTDCYNWDEEMLLRRAQKAHYDLRLITPEQYNLPVDHHDFPFLKVEKIQIQKGRLKIGNWLPESFMMSFAMELEDYQKDAKLYRTLVSQKIPHYGPFLMGLIASKNILVLLADPGLRHQLLGSSNSLSSAILPAYFLADQHQRALIRPEEFVLKHVDGFGGYQVFLGDELIHNLKKIKAKQYHEWILQQRTKLNSIFVDGILSQPKSAICDLGVFVQYDWSQGKLNRFQVGGYLGRATNRSYKVNVSSGGAQVAVMFDRKK